MNEGFRFYNIEIVFNTYVIKKTNRDMGHNHVNETARNGIITHHQWEENLGNVTKVILTDSFGFVARSLWFRCPNAISERNYFELLFSLLG